MNNTLLEFECPKFSHDGPLELGGVELRIRGMKKISQVCDPVLIEQFVLEAEASAFLMVRRINDAYPISETRVLNAANRMEQLTATANSPSQRIARRTGLDALRPAYEGTGLMESFARSHGSFRRR